MSALAAGAGAVLVGGLAVGLVKSVEAAGQFQASLNVLKAVTGATNVQMEKASKLAIALGNDAHLPAVSAKDAADAMLMLGKAGLTVVQSMGAARATLLLATAAETDNATAAKVVSQNLMAFHLSAKSASTIVDQMAGVMNNTGLVFAQFADSLTYTAAISHTVGQKFDDTATQIAILARAGIEGSMAGTGLRTVLSQLGNESSKASKNLKAMGVTTVDSHGNFVGMRSVIEQLAPSLDKMSKSQKLAFFQTNFGKYAMNAASIVLGEHAAAYDKVKLAIDRKGQADRLAASHMQGFTGAMAQLTNAVQTLEIEIGLKVLPVATRLALWLTAELPVAVAAATQAIAFLTPYFDQVKAVLEAVGQKFGVLGGYVQQAVDAFMSMKGHSDAIKAALGVLAVAIVAVTGVTIAMNLAFLANPIGLLVVALAALAAGLVLAYRNSETFRNIVNAVFDAVKVAASAALGWITNTGIPDFMKAWNAVAPVVKGVATAIISAVSGIVGGIRENWGTIKSIIVPPVEAAWNQVKLMFNTAKTVIINIVDGFKNLLEGHWGAAWGNLEAIVSAIFSQLTGTIENLIHGLSGTMLDKAAEIGRSIAQGIVNGVGNLVSSLTSALTGAVGGALGAVGSFIKKGSPSRLFADQIGQPIGQGITLGALEGIATLSSNITKSINNAITASNNAIKARQASFQTAWSQFTSGADAAFTKLHSSILTKTEQIIVAAQSAAAAVSLAGNLAAAQGQLASAQAGTPQTDAEKALAALQAAHNEAGLGQGLSSAQDQLTAAQAAAGSTAGQAALLAAQNAGGDAVAVLAAQQQAAIVAAQRQVSDAKYNIQVDGLNKQIAAESAAAAQSNAIANAQQAVDAANTAISDAAQQASWAQQAAAERVQLDARTALQQTHFDAALTKLQTHLANGHETYKQAQKAILKLFKSYGLDYANAGAALGDAFVTGLGESIQNAANRAGDVTGKTTGIGAAIAGAVGGKIPHLATGGFVSQTGLAVIHQGETVMPAGQGGGNVNITINGYVSDEHLEQMRNLLIRTGRNTTRGALGGFA